MKTISLRLPDEAYDAVKRYSEAENTSMNAWIEQLLDTEDMRRRCAAHDRWMSSHPEAVILSEEWADQAADELAQR
jgi:hypothetical protein